MAAVTVNDLLDGHVGLDVECLDRVYLNGYVPNLQVGGQVVSFMTRHLGLPIPSPAIMERIGTSFRRAVSSFAEANHIPVVRFGKTDRKIEVMRKYVAAQAKTGRSAVVAIGVAQEFPNVFAAAQRETVSGAPWFSFYKGDRRVTCFYFYLWDEDFGPAFIKVCAYFPYPVKVWVNGHEWAKRQATHAGLGFTALSNGFATCEDSAALQAICDRLGPGTIEVFFERWMSRLPLPLTDADRAAGYWWELSMRQIEVSRTLAFDAPRRARAFFEALVTDNLDLGRPDSVELIFTGRLERRGRPPKVDPVYKTKVVTRDTDVTVNAFYKHSRIKQYLKDGRALRIETVVNSPDDLRCHRRLTHLDELQTKARDVNRRVLDTERVGQGCVLASPAFERVALPTLTEDGRRAPALRFGDPRVMALLGALCVGLNALGFTNRSLRAQVSRLLGVAYTTNQMSYDLARLRLNGLIERIEGTNTYLPTPDGQRIAVFYTKIHDRLLRPLIASNAPPAPLQLRHALATIDRHVQDYITEARLGNAACPARTASPWTAASPATSAGPFPGARRSHSWAGHPSRSPRHSGNWCASASTGPPPRPPDTPWTGPAADHPPASGLPRSRTWPPSVNAWTLSSWTCDAASNGPTATSPARTTSRSTNCPTVPQKYPPVSVGLLPHRIPLNHRRVDPRRTRSHRDQHRRRVHQRRRCRPTTRRPEHRRVAVIDRPDLSSSAKEKPYEHPARRLPPRRPHHRRHRRHRRRRPAPPRRSHRRRDRRTVRPALLPATVDTRRRRSRPRRHDRATRSRIDPKGGVLDPQPRRRCRPRSPHGQHPGRATHHIQLPCRGTRTATGLRQGVRPDRNPRPQPRLQQLPLRPRPAHLGVHPSHHQRHRTVHHATRPDQMRRRTTEDRLPRRRLVAPPGMSSVPAMVNPMVGSDGCEACASGRMSDPPLPLYDGADAEKAIALLSAVGYDTDALVGDVTVRFHPAGHILGSASVSLHVAGRRILFSGDLGRGHHPLLQPPAPPAPADVLVVESTYGLRRHGARAGNPRRRHHPYRAPGRRRVDPRLRSGPHRDPVVRAAPADGPGCGPTRAGLRRQSDGPRRAGCLSGRAPFQGARSTWRVGGRRPVRPRRPAAGAHRGGVHAAEPARLSVHRGVRLGHGHRWPGGAPPATPAARSAQHGHPRRVPGRRHPGSRPGRGRPTGQDARPVRPGARGGDLPTRVLRPRRRRGDHPVAVPGASST